MHQRDLDVVQTKVASMKSAEKKAKLTRKILKTQNNWLAKHK